jgi:putative ABC transport system ATP-binding protein
MHESAALTAHALTKIYAQKTNDGGLRVDALRGVDLEFLPGELVVLLGPSGSGKSTLLHLLGGLDRATSGSILYQGRDLCQFSDRELTEFRRDHVGFVFQFYNLIPTLTALENVQLVTELAARRRTANPMEPLAALALVGMEGRAQHFPSQLSGGEQQRVAIARAVAKRPDLLFCDEPTGALDVQTGKLVLEAILKVNAELGALSLVITHNAAIAGIAHRVVRISEGRILSSVINTTRVKLSEVSW